MPRSNQTKRLLAQSLMDLMTTTPLEKISVNDIVDHAGVGRNTFYYHFEDKYDLVNWYFQSGVTQFLVERSAYASWNALLEAVEDYLLENKVFYCNALAYTGQGTRRGHQSDEPGVCVGRPNRRGGFGLRGTHEKDRRSQNRNM